MEYEDSRNALFVEPNAYVQNFRVKEEKKERKKIIFSEPYECLPPYHINNNFKNKGCDCVSKPKEKCEPKPKQNFFNFDFKSMLPLISSFGGKGFDLGNITKMLAGNETNSLGLISNLLSNKESLGNILNIFKGGKSEMSKTKEIKSTDFPIKDYIRVE